MTAPDATRAKAARLQSQIDALIGTEFEESAIRRHRAYVFYKPAAATELAETLTRAFHHAA